MTGAQAHPDLEIEPVVTCRESKTRSHTYEGTACS